MSSPSFRRTMSSTSAASQSALEPNDAPEPPAKPRFAWRETRLGEEEEGEEEDGEHAEEDPMVEIRRNWLAHQLLGDSLDAPGGAADRDEGTGAAGPSRTSPRFSLKTTEALESLRNLDRNLNQARAASSQLRDELSGYMDSLRQRTFATDLEPDASSTQAANASAVPHEPLVVMPRDFDEVVDMHAQISASRRPAKKLHDAPAPGAAPRQPARKSAPPKNDEETMTRLKLPAFLEKYFDDDIAAQQIPLLQLQDRVAPGKSEEPEGDDLAKGLQKIARLDTLLAKCEAEGSARLRASQMELELTRERLRRESQEANEEKVKLLQRLKERGLLRGNASSSRGASTLSTVAPPTAINSARSSAESALSVQQEPVLTNWCGWTSTADPSPTPEQPLTIATAETGDGASRPSTAGASDVDTAEAAEPDTATFDLTSITSRLAHRASAANVTAQVGAQPRSSMSGASAACASTPFRASAGDASRAFVNSMPSRSNMGVSTLCCREVLATVAEEVEGDQALVGYAEDTPFLLPDEPDVEALREIDERLRQLVPEQEWELKSITTMAKGSVADGEDVASRRPSSVRSGQAFEALADEPSARQQYEANEGERALAKIEERLWELRLSEPTGVDPLRGAQVRQLLLQAAQESEPMDSNSRVLALTNFSDKSSAADVGLDLVPAPASGLDLYYPESTHLQQARRILEKLEDDNAAWADAFGDAARSLDTLESDVRYLDLQAAGASAGSRGDADVLGAGDEAAGGGELLARLEDLGGQIASVLDRPDPVAALPKLIGADQASDGLEEESVLAYDPEAEEFDVDSSEPFDARPLPADGPNPALLRALDIELPSGPGAWDDDELERIVGAMKAHFGDEDDA